MSTQTNQPNPHEEKQASRRFNLAVFIIGPSLIILVVISAFMLRYTDIKAETIFTALIGLIGTWVGTILAFYYSKDNFDAASKGTQQLIDKVTSSQEKLKSLIARKVMLVKNSFHDYDLADGTDNVSLEEIRKAFGEFNRLPVFEKGLPKYVIHKSLLNEFIADFYSGAYDNDPSIVTDSGDREGDKAKLTLTNFLGVKSISVKAEGFVTAKIDDNLEEIKERMESIKTTKCSDAFITADGTSMSKVSGWITNVIILEKSKV